MKRQLAALALTALVLCAARPQDPPRRGGVLEPGLRRATAPQRVVIRLEPGAPLPAVAGVSFGVRVGDVVTATATPAALAALAAVPSVRRLEASKRVFLRNDVSHASTIGFRGTISVGGQVDSYTFAAAAGQTCRIAVHAEAALDPFLSVTDAAPVTDDNSGPAGDALLTIAWATGGSKTIDVSGVGGSTGAYLLFITASTPISPGFLAGGDIGVDAPHVAGTRTREARAIEGVDGAGIAIAVIDSGVDFAHADLRDPSGATRILSMWDQSLTPITGEKAPDVGGDGSTANDYGVFYSQVDIDKTLSGVTPGFVRQKDTDGHGTHVASIAAGDGSSFTGAAPGARLIVVKINQDSASIVDALDFVRRQADKLEVAGFVINLSLGTHDGPHDGTSALDQAVDAVSDRGRYVVVAAGNEGATRVHARQTIASTYTFTFTPSSTATSGNDPHIVDFWADGADTYTVTVTDPTFGDTVTALSGQTQTVGPTTFLQAITVDNRVDTPSNGATHIRVSINNAAPAVGWTIAFTRTASAGTGGVDGYAATESGAFAIADITPNPDGSIPGTVGEPGTATRAVTAGAYRGKFSWDNAVPATTVKADGIGAGIAGNIASFSSRGPTRDGRRKPDITAPGAYIAGALSTDASMAAADDDVDGVHTYLQGTSMAAPEVAGLLAVFLSKNRQLEIEPVKSTMFAGALLDGFTAAGDTWGAGKVDAVSLLASVPLQVDVEANAAKCSKSAAARPGPAWLLWGLVLVFLRRRR